MSDKSLQLLLDTASQLNRSEKVALQWLGREAHWQKLNKEYYSAEILLPGLTPAMYALAGKLFENKVIKMQDTLFILQGMASDKAEGAHYAVFSKKNLERLGIHPEKKKTKAEHGIPHFRELVDPRRLNPKKMLPDAGAKPQR